MIELNKIYNENCLDTMSRMEDNSIDAIVTDPPYGIGFMGKEWDTFKSDQLKVKREADKKRKPRTDGRTVAAWGNAADSGTYNLSRNKEFQEWMTIWAVECLRVLKPGGFLLAFGGTRTCHRLICAIEDAGFEIRDMIAWVYGSGFPKSLNIGKAVDKLQGNEREEVEEEHWGRKNRSYETESSVFSGDRKSDIKEGKRLFTKGTSEYEGWGTALKPALEPICIARKPLSEKTVALNVLKWGTGGINVDGCRIGYTGEKGDKQHPEGFKWQPKNGEIYGDYTTKEQFQTYNNLGRFPSNFIHDGSQEVLELFPDTKSGGGDRRSKNSSSLFNPHENRKEPAIFEANEGSASRFFYCAKASKSERNEGCEELEEKKGGSYEFRQDGSLDGKIPSNRNNHPTVKPIKLMRYLVRLVTPKGGVVYDPFIGSGTTGKACIMEGFDFIGSELDEEYYKIANARLAI